MRIVIFRASCDCHFNGPIQNTPIGLSLLPPYICCKQAALGRRTYVEKTVPILLAESHSRIGLYQVLMAAGFHVVAEAEDLKVCRTLLAAHRPYLLLLAGNLLPVPPAPFLTDLRQRYPAMKVALLLDDDDDLPLQELVNAGVNGMVLKTESHDAILQTVQAVATGNITFSPERDQKKPGAD